MLTRLVLIEQAVSRLFSISKRCGKGNCEKAAVDSRGGTRFSCEIWSGGLIILLWTVQGDRF